MSHYPNAGEPHLNNPGPGYGPPPPQHPPGYPAHQPAHGDPAAFGDPAAYGNPVPYGAPQQPGWGQPIPQYSPAGNGAGEVGPKSFVVAWILSLLLGGWGIDRFYLGKVGTGILKLVTFGGLGIWSLVDLIIVLLGKTRDRDGLLLHGYEKSKVLAWIVTAALLVVSLIMSVVIAATSASTVSAMNETTDSQPADDQPALAADEAEEAEASVADEKVLPDEEDEETSSSDASSWAESTFGTFTVISESGSGDALVDLPAGVEAGMVTATHSGSSNFVLNVLDSENQSTGDLLVNEIGSYAGTNAYGLIGISDDSASLEVTADGDWNLEIAPLADAGELEESGSGDNVYLYGGGAASIDAEHSGESNFAVWQIGDGLFNTELLINEIGAYSGTVPLTAGPSVVVITADGDWTMALN